MVNRLLLLRSDCVFGGSVMRYSLVILAGAFAAAAPAQATNLITNGDFSAGATGFSSTYSTTVNGTTADQGSYAAVVDPSSLCSVCFPSIGDHSSGTGNMLFVDSAGSNPETFWSQTFAVSANTSYDFSFWATSLGYRGPQPTLTVLINGVALLAPTTLPYTTGETATTWANYGANWSSGSATSATVSFFNTNLDYSYNDFALDDISFNQVESGVPEPATWAMMILGFGLIGAGLRRRRMAPTPA